MFAYRIFQQGDQSTTLPHQYDTIEVAVTPAQADRLFALTKSYFEKFVLTDVDTLSHIFYPFSHSEITGRIELVLQGQKIIAEVGALDESTLGRQSAAFFLVQENISQFFPEKSE